MVTAISGVLTLADGVACAQVPGGDPAQGKQAFADACGACHALEGLHQGPSLIGVMGRPAAGLSGFSYSPALKASGLVWTPDTLDQFLANPRKVVPGGAMTTMIRDPDERRDLIAYLTTLKPKAP